MPQDDKISVLHKNLTKKYSDFTMDSTAFREKMLDGKSLDVLWGNLKKKDPDFTMDLESFRSKMGSVSTQPEQLPTDPIMDLETEMSKSESDFASSTKVYIPEVEIEQRGGFVPDEPIKDEELGDTNYLLSSQKDRKRILRGLLDSHKQRLSESYLQEREKSEWGQIAKQGKERIITDIKAEGIPDEKVEEELVSRAAMEGYKYLSEDELARRDKTQEFEKLKEAGDFQAAEKLREEIAATKTFFIDPETGQRFDQPETEEQELYVDAVTSEMERLKQTDEEKWKDIYLEYYYRKSEMERLYNDKSKEYIGMVEEKTEPQVLMGREAATQMFGASRTAEKETNLKRYRKLYHDAEAKFEAVSKMYIGNTDPASIKKDLGYVAGQFGKGVAMGMLPEKVHDLLPRTQRDVLDASLEIFSETGEVQSQEQIDKFKRTWGESLTEFTGGLTGIFVPLGIAGKALKGAGMITGLNKVVKAWKKGSKIKKLAAGMIDIGMEELKFTLIGGAPGAGAGFGLAAQLKTGMILPKRLQWAQGLVNIATGAGGATVGMEMAKGTEALVSSFTGNKEFDVEFEKHFGDLSTNEGVKNYLRDLSVTAVGNLLYSGANIEMRKALNKIKPPESLTPEEVTEAKKLFLEKMTEGEEKLKEVSKKPPKEVSPEQEGEVPEKKEEVLEKSVEKKEEKPEVEKGEEYLETEEYIKSRKQAREKLIKAIEKTREKINKEGVEETEFPGQVRDWRKQIIKTEPRVDKDWREVVNKKELDEYEKIVKKDLIETEQKLKELKEVESGKLVEKNSDVYNYQDTHGEKAVKLEVKGDPETRLRLENAGDILRELSKHDKGYASDSYIGEKINKIKKWIDSPIVQQKYNDFVAKNQGRITDYLDAYKDQPVYTTQQQKAKDIILSLIKGDIDAVKKGIKEVGSNIKKFIEQNKKEVEDAIQEPKAEKIPVGEPAKPSEKVDKEIREPDKKEPVKEAGEKELKTLDIKKSVGAAIEGFGKKAAKEFKDLGILFSGGKFTKKVKPEGIIKFGIQKKTLQQEKRRVDVMRSVIKDVIKDNEAVLKRIHGRVVPAMMRKLENAKTARSMNRAIDYIEKVVGDKKTQEEFVRKENALAGIEKKVQKKTHFIKGLNRNRIKYPDSKVFEAMVDRISGKRGQEGIKDIIKNKDSEKALEEMKGLEVRFENPELTEGQRIKIQNRMQDLGFSGLYDMSAKQVEGKLSELKDIVKGATAEGIAEREARIEADVKEYDWYVDILAKKAFKKGEVVSQEEPMTDQTKINKLPEKYRRWYNPFGIFMNNIPVVLDKMSKYDPLRKKTFDNQMHWKIMPKIWEGLDSYAENTETANKMLENKRKEIYKPKNNKDMRRILKNNAVALKTPIKEKIRSRLGLMDRVVTERVEFKNKETGETDYLDLNQNIASKYWLMLQDPKLDKTFFSEITHDRRGLQKGMGWSDSHVKVIEDYMTPEMKKWSEFLLNEYYPWIYEKVNPTYRRMNGTDLNYTEFYTNIAREGGGKPSSIEETMAGESMMSTVSNGSLLNRTGSTLPLRGGDVNRSMLAYTESMLYYTSWAEPVRYMQKIFKNPRIKNAAKQWHTRDPIDHMNRLIDMLANRQERQVIGHKLVNGIRKRFVIGTIGLKGTVSVKQLFSQPAYLVSLGAKNTTRAVAEFTANPKKAWDTTMENPQARRRIQGLGGDADVVYAMAKDFRKGGGTKDWVKFFMVNVRYSDIAPIVLGYPKLYEIEYNKAKKSMSVKDAKKHAQKAAWENTNMWQQSSETAYLSPLQLENAYAKLFTMYMTAPLSYHRQATRSLANLADDVKRGRHHTSAGRKVMGNHVKRFVVAHVVLPQLFTYAMNGLQWEKDEQWRALLFGNITNLPFIGDIVTYALDFYQGKPFDYAPTPTSSVVKYSVRLIKMIGKMMEEENDNVSVGDILDVVADVASTTTGIPVTGVHNTVGGAADILKGETQYPFRRLVGFSEYELQEGTDKKEEKEGGKRRAR